MATLRITGDVDETARRMRTSAPKRFRVAHAIRPGRARSDREEEVRLEGLADDDVIELTLAENDLELRRWLTVAEYRAEFGAVATRGDAPDELVVPARLPVGGRERGFASWALKLLRVFQIDPIAEVAKRLPPYYDRKLVKKPGLHRVTDLGALGAVAAPGSLDGDAPLLVFIHGTASTTAGSFGKLDARIWRRLQEAYGDRILALEHHTLARHPIENARDLVQGLPRRATLHLVTHSRGGLVGELLCRAARVKAPPFDDTDTRLMAGHPKRVRDALAELADEMGRREIAVERFVRVACPAGGTLLASKRLDRWLEVVLNLVGLIPVLGDNPVFDVLSDLLLDLKKQAGEPGGIPGVAAMVPGGALVRLLNRPDVTVAADLSVIAGDTESGSLLGRVALFFADRFYREDHDLVVHTRAMYGGAPRAADAGARSYFDTGEDVNHFRYFLNPATAAQVGAALLEDPPPEFVPIGEPQRVEAARGITRAALARRSAVPQPRVFLLPGIMGSHLQVGSDRIWLDLLDIALGRIGKLGIDAAGVSPESLVARSYGDLCDHLANTHEVLPFPYDWRRPILEEAHRFGHAVQAALDESPQPVRILAHSMGGLVARAMFHERPDVWDAFRGREGARLVMLGTPNGGSYSIPRVLLGRDRIAKTLATIDLRHSLDELLGIVSRYPGLLDLLPVADDAWDLLKPADWNKLARAHGRGWRKPAQEDLEACRALRRALARSPIDPTCMVYVAGDAPDTPVGIELDPSAKGEDRIRFMGTAEGDGRVPWDTGLLKDVPTWFMDASHGDLADHAPAFDALYELLHEGTTRLLRRERPVARSAAERYYRLRDDELDLQPDQEELERVMLGQAPRPLVEAERRRPVEVQVAHGNLAFCKNAVAVGHYEGDGFFGAEWALDDALDGRLHKRQQLGLYPGPADTCEVILEPGAQPGGAIVIGLGDVGELTPRALTRGVTKALLEFALRSAEEEARPPCDRADDHADGAGASARPRAATLELAFSALFIGSGEGGVGLEESIASILQAVLAANETLRGERRDRPLFIGTVQFIELYKDKAILAARILDKEYTRQPAFAVAPEVASLDGGRTRVAYAEDDAWWSRLHIRAPETDAGKAKDRLVFTTPGRRARAEAAPLAVQRENIDRFIERAVSSPGWDVRLTSALFELLVPNKLKQLTQDARDILLVLDEEAARYPWELLHDRQFGTAKPMAVVMGMVRQLVRTRYRADVVDVKTRKALVVGDPPSAYVPLPGAAREAQHVGELLAERGYDVRPEIRTSAEAVMTSLMCDDYRVLHLAGHGVYRFEASEGRIVTGMILGGGVFVTAQEIRQMRQVPELVFVNCCHLGRIDEAPDPAATATAGEGTPQPAPLRSHPLFAASFAEALIAMGVRMVVVAGWAVDDAAALAFADTFYRRLLDGDRFGKAAHEARKTTHALHGGRTNTWGAYQCYGYPDYRLSQQRPRQPADGPSFVDPDELCAWLRNVASDARASSARDERGGGVASHAYLGTKLQRLVERTNADHPAWLQQAEVQEALGRAHGELGLYAEAVAYYTRAVEADRGQASIAALEQRANLRARWAAADETRKIGERRDMIDRSIAELRGLLATCGLTAERGSLLGSAWKRLAGICLARDVAGALDGMAEGYALALTKRRDTYRLSNVLVAQAAAYWLGTRRAKPAADLVADVMPLAQEARRADPDLWGAMALVDATLAQALAAGDAARIERLAADYRPIWRRIGSPRQKRSVREHVSFLRRVLNPRNASRRISERRKRVLKRLHAAATKLHADLAAD